MMKVLDSCPSVAESMIQKIVGDFRQAARAADQLFKADNLEEAAVEIAYREGVRGVLKIPRCEQMADVHLWASQRLRKARDQWYRHNAIPYEMFVNIGVDILEGKTTQDAGAILGLNILSLPAGLIAAMFSNLGAETITVGGFVTATVGGTLAISMIMAAVFCSWSNNDSFDYMIEHATLDPSLP